LNIPEKAVTESLNREKEFIAESLMLQRRMTMPSAATVVRRKRRRANFSI